MRLFILGATGGTGIELISQGLSRGHAVTAFVRSPEKVAPRAGLTVIGGDVLDAAALEGALRGHDAVLSTLGSRQNVPTTLCRDAMAATVKAMQGAGVRRLLAVSASMLFRGGPALWLARTILRHVAQDLSVMEERMRQSDLDWTIVRPPRLTDGPRTGRERWKVDAPIGFTCSRADVADFLLNAVEQNQHVRALVGVSK